MNNREFMTLLFNDTPAGAHGLMCTFKGDPNNDANWTAHVWDGKRTPKADRNNYCTISSFTEADGQYRRRKAQFAALHAVMIDDLGTGPGSKLSMDLLKIKPTVLIETSPDNYQAWIKLSEPVTDRIEAEKLIKAMIHQGLLADIDPGMNGVTRVGRLPVGVNGKPKYNGWTVRVAEAGADIRYSIDEIIEAYDLDLTAVTVSTFKPRIVENPDKDFALMVFNALGMVRSEIIREGDLYKVHIECPWIDEHTDRSDTGTAYFIGNGFKCHHGHCDGRNFKDVMTWMHLQGIDISPLNLPKPFHKGGQRG